MIYYHGYAIEKNLGDDACFQAFIEMLRPEYRNLVTKNPDKNCMLAVLGGGILITNQNENGFYGFKGIIDRIKIKETITFGTGYDFIENEGSKSWTEDVKKTFNEEDCYWRGPITLDEMKGYGRVSGDSALCFLNRLNHTSKNGEKYGISYGPSKGKYKTDDIFEFLKNLDKKYIKFMPVCKEDLDTMISDFGNICDCSIENDFLKYMRLIRNDVKIMLSMKLHSSIASYCAGVDYINFQYRIKCKDFEQSKEMIDLKILSNGVNEKIDKLV